MGAKNENKQIKESEQDINNSHEHFSDVDEISEIIDSIPDPHTRKQVERVMVSQFEMIGQISPQMGIAKKITSDHITTYMETQQKAMENTFRESREKRWFFLALVVVACCVLFGVILLLRDAHPELMEKIITILLSAIFGGAGGYGIGYKKGQSDD